jgi:polyisoprenoid-binding protein YceI
LKTIALVCFTTTLALGGCKNNGDRPSSESAAATAQAAEPDRVVVLARHRWIAGQADLDADPVVVHFEKVTVTKASFDPKNLEGGMATIELDPTSIKTGDEERDTDLKSPEFFDVAQFATITVDIANVKKQGGTKYSADATVGCHGVTKTYPVTFEVVATTADSVRIKGEHSFNRLDFAIGVDPAKDQSERIDTGLVTQWALTLKKT